MSPPKPAVTLGDVAGIGPAITAKALLGHDELRAQCIPVVVDEAAMRRGVSIVGADPDAVQVIATAAQASNTASTIALIHTGLSLSDVPVGELSAIAGDGPYRFVVDPCHLARIGEVDGIVTPPLNKAAMHAGGHNRPGHTELLAHEFGVTYFSLVLSAGDLYSFHLTTHVSMRQEIEDITFDRTLQTLELAGAFTRSMGRLDEVIGVAWLNSHAGENQFFGNEDAEILAPAVAAARSRGLNMVGPLPGDALGPAAVRGKYNVVVACYHGQFACRRRLGGSRHGLRHCGPGVSRERQVSCSLLTARPRWRLAGMLSGELPTRCKATRDANPPIEGEQWNRK